VRVVSGYLAAYALTLAVEPPLYALALRLLGDRWRRGYGAGLLVNATSHPLTWLVLWPLLSPVSRAGALVAGEAFAVAWEAGWLRRALRHDLLPLVATALAANAVSLGLGALLPH
jgi:hypothetical protein